MTTQATIRRTFMWLAFLGGAVGCVSALEAEESRSTHRQATPSHSAVTVQAVETASQQVKELRNALDIRQEILDRKEELFKTSDVHHGKYVALIELLEERTLHAQTKAELAQAEAELAALTGILPKAKRYRAAKSALEAAQLKLEAATQEWKAAEKQHALNLLASEEGDRLRNQKNTAELAVKTAESALNQLQSNEITPGSDAPLQFRLVADPEQHIPFFNAPDPNDPTHTIPLECRDWAECEKAETSNWKVLPSGDTAFTLTLPDGSIDSDILATANKAGRPVPLAVLIEGNVLCTLAWEIPTTASSAELSGPLSSSQIQALRKAAPSQNDTSPAGDREEELWFSVHDANGQPAVGAKVIVGTAQHPVCLHNGERLSYQAPQSISIEEMKTIATFTNGDGMFHLPIPTQPYEIAIVHDSGVGLFSIDDLQSNHQLTLNPWGSVQGYVRLGNRVQSNLPVELDVESPATFARLLNDTWENDPLTKPFAFIQNVYRTTTNNNGYFTFSHVAPGTVALHLRFKQESIPDDTISITPCLVRVDSNAVTTVELDENGIALTGTMQLSGFEEPSAIDWSKVSLQLIYDLPPKTQETEPSPVNHLTVLNELDRSYEDFYTSPAGQSLYRASIPIRRDGTFRIANTFPGIYRLQGTLPERGGFVTYLSLGKRAWLDPEREETKAFLYGNWWELGTLDVSPATDASDLLQAAIENLPPVAVAIPQPTEKKTIDSILLGNIK